MCRFRDQDENSIHERSLLRPGQRAVEIMAAGSPLENGRIYSIATDGFLATGKSGYRMVANSNWRLIRRLRDIVVSGLSQMRDLPAIEGRLVFH